MVNDLIKFADLLDARGYFKAADHIDALIKSANVLEVYHGTSSVFLHGILKEGLSPNPKQKVWSGGSERHEGDLDMESYPGAYVTNNFMTAYSAAFSAKQKFGGNRLIVAGRIETRTPEARIDEDHVKEPGFGIAIENGLVSDWGRSVSLLEHMEFDTDETDLAQMSKAWIEKALKIKPTEELMKRAVVAMRNWLTMRVSLRYEVEKKGNYWSDMTNKLKRRFNGEIPEKYTNTAKAISSYRQAMDAFLAKAKELLHSSRQDSFITNVRLTKPIAYKGANKIEAIVEFIKDEEKPTEIKVHYSSNQAVIDRLLNDFRKGIGSNYVLS